MGNRRGFEELPHTADRSVRVWAGDLEGLFEEAARAFYSIAGCESDSSTSVARKFCLEACDMESLLVRFLNELNHYLNNGFLPNKYKITIDKHQLHAILEGASSAGGGKEVKAVTFHNLVISENSKGYEVTLVFDV
jgi:SHS2 domain-containing protein